MHPLRFSIPGLICLWLGFQAPVFGQQFFDLRVPGTNTASQAEVTPQGLFVVDGNGKRDVYDREPAFDTDDRQFIGYYSQNLNVAIRWPVANRGRMQIGEETVAGWRFSPTQMVITPLGGQALGGQALGGQMVPGGGIGQLNQGLPGQGFPGQGLPGQVLPGQGLGGAGLQPGMNPAFPGNQGLGGAQQFGGNPLNAQPFVMPKEMGYYRLTTLDAIQNRLYLAALGNQTEAVMTLRAESPTQTWRIVPVNGDLVRIQGLRDGWAQSLVTVGPQGPTTLAMLDDNPAQLWRVQNVPNQPGSVSLESLAYPGRALAGAVDGVVSVERFSGAPSQQWILEGFVPPAPVMPALQIVARELRPKPPLTSAPVDLYNSSRRELWIVLGDLRGSNRTKEYRIPAGQSERVGLPRDAGAQMVEVYESRSLLGEVQRQEIVTEIPPRSFFDISVYELALKSVAIDRTGKSPNAIEETNYQPKSVGFFVLPPGDELQPGPLDLYDLAIREKNPGAVRRLDMTKFVKPNQQPDVLEKIIQGAR